MEERTEARQRKILPFARWTDAGRSVVRRCVCVQHPAKYTFQAESGVCHSISFETGKKRKDIFVFFEYSKENYFGH